jgi:hypothetical protein
MGKGKMPKCALFNIGDIIVQGQVYCCIGGLL